MYLFTSEYAKSLHGVSNMHASQRPAVQLYADLEQLTQLWSNSIIS